MNDTNMKLPIVIVLTLGLVGALWYFRDVILPAEEEPVLVQPEPVAAEEPARLGPLHPLPPRTPARSSGGELVPLPALDDSDSYFLLALTDIFGPDVGRLFVNEALIDKLAATVDNLPRGQLSENVRPVGALADAFIADPSADGTRFYLNQSNFARYDTLIELAVGANLERVVDVYGRFYPLFQQSYERLGYPNAYFNDRVVEVIDHLLETPEPSEPIPLVRPHVLYEFADPELEALSSGQKLLLRIGSEHRSSIKQTLRNLRALIAQSQT